MKRPLDYIHASLRVALALAMAVTGLWVYAGNAETDEGTAWPAVRAPGRDIPADRGESASETPTTHAQLQLEPDGVLTLRRALELALMRSPELAASSHGVGAAEGYARQAATRGAVGSSTGRLGIRSETTGMCSPHKAVADVERLTGTPLNTLQ